MDKPVYDIAIVGGGINGCGIARDAAGRGLSVFLCEQNDLANGTSSASTKLIHGGLRYLEYYEFRLVREALTEREVLLRAAPHIIWPLRFILPHHKGLRPGWLMRLGLFLYDNLGGRKLLPPTSVVNLATDETGKCLKADYSKGFEYSDCWVIDSRLVALNAMDARDKGATIQTRTKFTGAKRENGLWSISLQGKDGKETAIQAKTLINAAGPWLDTTLETIEHSATKERIRMVKGSHIIIKSVFNHSKAYIFQNADGRIIFAIPYEKDFTLIGTTDVDFRGEPSEVKISPQEINYLCEAASEYFTREITPESVVSTFSGIRPLFDDGKSDAKAATRDYVLKIDDSDNVPLLSIYGGKITTYRKLAESVLDRLRDYLPNMAREWTEGAHLPGGDFAPDSFQEEVQRLKRNHPYLPHGLATRLIRLYGTIGHRMTEPMGDIEDMGIHFGGDLYEFEVRYLMVNEWCKTPEDVLWRRTNTGLTITTQEAQGLEEWMSSQAPGHQ